MKNLPPLSATGIGSVPFLDVDWTLDLIARVCPVLPHWPTFVHRRPREDMLLGAVDGLPLLEMDEEARRVTVRSEGREEALTEFYEHFLANDLDYFKVPPEAEVGLTALLERVEKNPDLGPEFLKAQVIGPISFGTTLHTPDDKNLIDDPELADAAAKGLGMKAAWLAEKIRSAGREPLIFIDEPGLTGYGSAFSTLSREKVIEALNETFAVARLAGEVKIGTHVCGNTDWGLLTETDLDVINFDAFGYLEHFLLYPEQIKRFLERGGYVAWGIVPTLALTGQETAEQLAGKLTAGFKDLASKGLSLDLIRERALITPACGTGPLDVETAQKVYQLLFETTAVLNR